MNKKGTSLVQGFAFIFIALLFAIFLGVAVFGFSLVNDVLDEDVEIGQTNLQDINSKTFGKINQGMIDNADTIGIIFLLGMLLLMILNGYFLGSKMPKIFFVVDVFLLALFFIPAIYVSQTYETFINSTTILSNTYINIIPKVSKFMLNLPSILATAGVITMILSYAGIRQSTPQGGDGSNVAGY